MFNREGDCLAAKLWPGRVFTLLSNFADADLMTALSDRLVPVPLLASSWVNPAACENFLGRPKVYDLVMLANGEQLASHAIWAQPVQAV